MMGKKLRKSKMLVQIGTKISENTIFGVKFPKKKLNNTILRSPWKNQNLTQNPPTYQNHPTMMAKNLRFSKKYSKSNYNMEVQKVQNLQFCLKNHPIMMGKNICNFVSKITLQWWAKISENTQCWVKLGQNSQKIQYFGSNS